MRTEKWQYFAWAVGSLAILAACGLYFTVFERLTSIDERLSRLEERVTDAHGLRPGTNEMPSGPSVNSGIVDPTLGARATADIPFQLNLEEFTIAGLPGLHSVAHAIHGGKLVLVAGRKNGMHGFSPNKQAAKMPAFPRDEANDQVYVVDLESRTLLGSSKVDRLPETIANQLRSTNTQSVSSKGWLYIVGGHGTTADERALVTYDQVVAIELAPLMERVSNSQPLDMDFARKHVYVGSQRALAITGGDLKVKDNYFFLVLGHRFDGEYTPGGGLADQEYSESVRAFTFDFTNEANEDGIHKLQVNYLGKQPPTVLGQDPDGPYHRRDLSVESAIADDGTPHFVAYGGVFKGGRFEAYLQPLRIKIGKATSASPMPPIALEVDDKTEQLLSQYRCPVVSIYSASTKTMYATFYGGIGQYWWDDKEQVLKRDLPKMGESFQDGMPFINSISTLRVNSESRAQYLHVGQQFPPHPLTCGDYPADHLGTETLFVLSSPSSVRGDIIWLDEISDVTTVGFLLGGIAATGPYAPNGSCASPAIYKVTLVPQKATKTIRLHKPASP